MFMRTFPGSRSRYLEGLGFVLSSCRSIFANDVLVLKVRFEIEVGQQDVIQDGLGPMPDAFDLQSFAAILAAFANNLLDLLLRCFMGGYVLVETRKSDVGQQLFFGLKMASQPLAQCKAIGVRFLEMAGGQFGLDEVDGIEEPAMLVVDRFVAGLIGV